MRNASQSDGSRSRRSSLARSALVREEVLRRHGLEHVELLDEDVLDGVDALEQVPGPPQPTVEHRVVRRRVRLEDLLGEELVDTQVGAVGEAPALLAEGAVALVPQGSRPSLGDSLNSGPSPS